MKILRSYGLVSHLWKFLEDGYFPEKPTWKKLFRKSVTLSHISQREIRMSHDNDFTPFSRIYADSKPSKIFDIPENYKEIELCKFISKLCTSTRTTGQFQTCVLCNKVFLDAFQHSSCVSPTTAAIRDNWWYGITNPFDIRLCAELCGLSETDLYLVLLGHHKVYESENKAFRLLNFQFVRSAATQYNRALNSP